MIIGAICEHKVTVAGRGMPLPEAAKLMRERHVGSLVVVESADNGRVPVGIVTDRDIVVEVLAKDLDYRKLSVGDIMSTDLLCVNQVDEVRDVIALMRRRGVRRVPVLNAAGAMVGIASLDDLLDVVAEQLGDLAITIASEQSKESQRRR
jgi:CBS domain-containing protein